MSGVLGMSGFFRKALPYTSVLLLIVACYTGWTLWSRSRDAHKAAQQQQRQEAQQDAAIVQRYGAGQLKIMAFYGSPAAVKRGEKALICYGVVNAKTVSITPHIDDLTPALSRCLEVHPVQDTEYRLTTADAAGHTAQQSFVLRVTP